MPCLERKFDNEWREPLKAGEIGVDWRQLKFDNGYFEQWLATEGTGHASIGWLLNLNHAG